MAPVAVHAVFRVRTVLVLIFAVSAGFLLGWYLGQRQVLDGIWGKGRDGNE